MKKPVESPKNAKMAFPNKEADENPRTMDEHRIAKEKLDKIWNQMQTIRVT